MTNYRKSRISVPRGRSTQMGLTQTSLNRPQSVDRYSARASSLLPLPSTTKKIRSQSQTPRTAFLTPTTPGNRTPLSNSYLRSADKRGPVEDKIFIHREAARITDFAIRHNISGFGKDLKLRNITYKQFTGLLDYMIEILVGNRFPQQGDVTEALHALDYPYFINKSWLKTPTAGHAFNHVVLMLGWLLNLIEPPLMPEGDTMLDDFGCINNLVHDKEFPTIMFQKVFMEKAREGFKMWNLQEDAQFEKLNEELTNMHVEQSTHSAVKSIKQLDDDIVSLENKNKQMLLMVKPSTKHQQHMELEKEVIDLKRILESKKEIVQQLMASIASESETYENEQKILKQREIKIDQLRAVIKMQSMSKDGLKHLIDENYLLRHIIEAEQKSIEEFLEKNEGVSVEMSRLMKQKVQKVNEFNHCMYECIKHFGSFLPNFNPSDYELNSNSNLLLQLKSLKPILQEIKVQLMELSKKFRSAQDNMQVATQKLSVEFEQNQRKLKQSAEKFALDIQAINKILSDLDKKFADVDQKYNDAKFEKENLKLQVAKIKAHLETEKHAIKKVTEQKDIIMNRFLEEQQQILQEMEEQSKVVQSKVEHYKDVRDKLKEEVTEMQKELRA